MPKITLTDLAVQRLKPPTGNQVDYWDKSLPGFGIRVAKGGTKTFVVLINRQRKSLGRYPALTLKEARGTARKMLLDPIGYQREIQQLDLSYLEAVERYLRIKEGELSANTSEWYARFLRRFNFPGLVREVRAHEIEDALQRIRGQSNRSHGYTVLKIFFGWCLAREYCAVNPMQNLKKPRIPSARERVLEDWELVAIWQATEDMGKYGSIVRLLMLTGQRRGQFDRLQESWVEKDGITFPNEVMKNGQEHYCPIGSLARFVLMTTIGTGG